MRISINGPIIQNSTSSKQLLYRVTRDSEESKYNDNICVCMYIILTSLLIILTSIKNYLYINDPNFEHLKISMSTYKAKNLLLKASTFGGTSTPCWITFSLVKGKSMNRTSSWQKKTARGGFGDPCLPDTLSACSVVAYSLYHHRPLLHPML